MTKFLAIFHLDDPASLKRAIASVLGTLALLFVNPFLTGKGLPPVSDEALVAAAGVVVTFLLQSGANSAAAKLAAAKAAGDQAAAAITDLASANAALGTSAKEAP